jgi:hypothetical protein
VLEAIAIIIGALGVLYGVVFGIVKVVGGSFAGGVARVADLAVWTLTVVQVLAQTSRSMPSDMPAAVIAWNEILLYTQLENVAVPAACLPGDPFANQVDQMLAVLGIALMGTLCVAVLARHQRDPTGDKPSLWIRLVTVFWTIITIALTAMYSLIANTAVGLVACNTVTLPASAYVQLAYDGATARNAGLAVPLMTSQFNELLRVSLLIANPNQVCYEGHHTAAAAVAWVTLLLYVVGFPVLVAVWLWVRVPRATAFWFPSKWREARARVASLGVTQTERQSLVNAKLK